jgi:hypothetical protein
MEELLVPKSIPTNILPAYNHLNLIFVDMPFTNLVLYGFTNHILLPMTIEKPGTRTQDFSLFILWPPIDNNLIGLID